jgi:hypothetical protein
VNARWPSGRGDLLVVTRLDPLARSTRDLNVLEAVKQAGAGRTKPPTSRAIGRSAGASG